MAQEPLKRRQAELIARSWLEHAALAFPREAAIAARASRLKPADRVRLAQPLITVARALLNRSEEGHQLRTHKGADRCL